MSQAREALLLLTKAETAFLLLCGWRPAKSDNLDGGWTPPDGQYWEAWARTEAIAEARRRAEREAALIKENLS